ncbi:MAG: flagellar hook protein FlgE [Nitrospirae bacterium]|nr:flagellar hook protein FlgE [Nitrospirota bacterium]
MITSLWTAISGMNTNSSSLGVVGDNIANMNTTAFKGSRANFGDVLSQQLSTGTSSGQIGRGSLLSSVSQLFTQGSFISTGNALDMAIDGNGFFVVKDPSTSNGYGTSTYYTRAGNFSLDKNGYLVTPTGLRVQGYMATDVSAVGTNTFSGGVTDVRIQANLNTAKQTSKVNTALNLNSRASAITAAFTLDANGDGINNDPANYNYSNTTTVYDSQGGAHEVTAYYTKASDNSWQVHYAYKTGSSTSVTASSPVLTMATGTVQTLTFDSTGALVSDGSASSSAVPVTYFSFGDGVSNPQGVTFDYGISKQEGGTGLTGTLQLADSNQILTLSQDGYAPGALKSVNVDESGIITAVFSNGQSRVLGEVVLARFAAADQLTKKGNNLFIVSNNSGEAIIGAPKTSGLGRIIAGSLESSNVDLGTEFVTMITNQRAFQANSKSVQTTDEILQDVLTLKR